MTTLHDDPHEFLPVASDDRSPDLRAEAFQGVRAARRNELAEDYVELIAELIHSHGEARPVDIATRMGITAPTVAKTLNRLARDGLITRAKYRSVFLTEQGRALAKECRHRHEIVLRFLLSLGLDTETAERDAEGIEHHVSERTLELFAAFVSRNRPGALGVFHRKAHIGDQAFGTEISSRLPFRKKVGVRRTAPKLDSIDHEAAISGRCAST